MIPRPSLFTSLALSLSLFHPPVAAAAAAPKDPEEVRSHLDSATRNEQKGDLWAALADYRRADLLYQGPPESAELARIVSRIVQYERELYAQDRDLERLCRASERLTRQHSGLPPEVAEKRKSAYDTDKKGLEQEIVKAKHTCLSPAPGTNSPASAPKPAPPAAGESTLPAPPPSAESAEESAPTAKLPQKPSPLSAVDVAPRTVARPQHARPLIIGGALALGAGAGFFAMMIGGAWNTGSYWQKSLDCYTNDRKLVSKECLDNYMDQIAINKAYMTVGGLLAGASLAAGVLLLRAGVRLRRGQLALGPQLHQPGAVVRLAF